MLPDCLVTFRQWIPLTKWPLWSGTKIAATPPFIGKCVFCTCGRSFVVCILVDIWNGGAGSLLSPEEEINEPKPGDILEFYKAHVC